MGKLELEKIICYLPYRLKAEMLDYKSDYVNKQYDEIVGVHQWDKNGLYWSALTAGGSKPNIERIKPILRPLSDLTKEIEHKGEKINIFDKIEIYKGSGVDYLIEQIKLGLVEVIIFNLLLEYHFDVFSLIDQGLATDINTI